MITAAQAKDKAEAHLRECTVGCDDNAPHLVIVNIEEYDFGWVFFYQSKRYLETGEFRHQLAGNAPLIVDRTTGRVVATGTALGLEHYIENYRKFGDPHVELSRVVLISGLDYGANKVAATQAIRDHTDLGLAAAKELVDRCVEGEDVRVFTKDCESASQLTQRLQMLRFNADRLPEGAV